jgi:predicted CopG family antitoxin
MGNITLALPNELQTKMKKHSEIRWSEVIRRTIQKKIEDLELLDKLTSKSTLTEKDSFEISKIIDASVSKKLGLIK